MDTSHPKRHVVIFVEPEASGHHLSLYGRAILKGGIDRGWSWLWLTSPHASKHSAARQLLNDFGSYITPVVANFPPLPDSTGRGEWMLYEWRHYFTLRASLAKLQRKYSISSVYLAWIDYCPRMLGIFGVPLPGLRFCGMHMHPTLHLPCKRSSLDCVNRFLNRRIYSQSNLSKIAIVTEPFLNYIQQTNLSRKNSVILVPEIAGLSTNVDRNEARQRIHAAHSDCVLLLYGALSQRKGIAELAAACSQLKNPERWIVWFAGVQDPSAEREISRCRASLVTSNIRIVEWNRFLSDREEAMAFAAADIAWLGYRVNLGGSSGVLLLAASAEVPVLACNQGIVGQVVRNHRLGHTVNIRNSSEVATALESLRIDKTARLEWKENGRRLAEQHRPDMAAGHILDMIENVSQPHD